MNQPAVRVSLVLFLAISLIVPPAGAVEVRDVLGAAHVAGKYNFTDDDFLNEGADRLLEMGSRVVKVWFRRDAAEVYSFNSDWLPVPETYAELAQKPYYRELFDKPFTTYVLVIPPAVTTGDLPFLDGMTPVELRDEKAEFYRLAKHLLRTYAGTGKTFVLQNWEGDHLLRSELAPGAEPDAVRLEGIKAWWMARQEGVEDARREVGMHGVTVAHAVEVNLVIEAMQGKVTVTNSIVPDLRADLYSYSSWDVGFDRTRLVQALDYLKAKAPKSQLYGDDNIFLGEFGGTRDQVGPDGKLRDIHYGLAEAALGWGARWVLYWQVYCNAAAHVYRGRPKNSDLRGFWLVRPDGSKAPIWQDFKRRVAGTMVRASLDNAGRPITAEGGALRVRRRSTPAASFTLTDWNGGTLRNGDTVSLQTRDGLFWSVDESGAVTPLGVEALAEATFTLWKVEGRGDIVSGDTVALQTADGEQLLISGGLLRTGSGKVIPAATFRLRLNER